MENKELKEAAYNYSEGYGTNNDEESFIAGALWQSSQPINSGWVLCDDDMPELDETVWITNGCGWTALGCLVECEGGYCWAELVNGLVYQEGDKIVAECEADDMDVVFWHRLPSCPKQ
jgi:hypothetical protein